MQLHSGFHLHIFGLKDSKNKFILIDLGTLLQILGAMYETISGLRISGIKFFMISKIVTVWDVFMKNVIWKTGRQSI